LAAALTESTILSCHHLFADLVAVVLHLSA